MSGYRHSGLTQQEYEERETLRAADEIRSRQPDDHRFERDVSDNVQRCVKCELPHAQWSGEPCPNVRQPEQPEPASVRAAQFRASRDSLIGTMVVYGIAEEQARIQVEALIRATRMLNVEDL